MSFSASPRPSSASSGGGATGTITDILAAINISTNEALSQALASGIPPLAQFAAILEKLPHAIYSLATADEGEGIDEESLQQVRDALVALAAELRRAGRAVAKAAVRYCPTSHALLEGSVREMARCLGLLAVARPSAPPGEREKVGGLYRELLGVQFDPPPPALARPSQAAGVGAGRDLGDVVAMVKSAAAEEEEEDDEDEEGELHKALDDLEAIIAEGAVGEKGSAVIAALLNRLGSESAKSGHRVKILVMLRKLASRSEENKEMMADPGALSIIIQSLTADCNESKEAVGLLLDMSDVPRVRQRIGRVPGCIEKLVVLLGDGDPHASCDSQKFLHAISSNTQNVLLMMEAGYFVPMVHYLKEGSDMNKILIATAISKMELTDEMKADLGKAGSIEPLVKMFTFGKLEAKLSSLGALQNLSTLEENVPLLISAGIVSPLLQLLFSVTSVMVTLREPSAAILSCVSRNELILKHKDVAQQMLSLLSISKPIIQYHLLQALDSIASYQNAPKVRTKMRKSGAIQLILPFLAYSSDQIRQSALNLLYTLSKDAPGNWTEKIGETHLTTIIQILSVAIDADEKAAAAGILNNLPINDKKATDLLRKSNLLPTLVSLFSLYTAVPSSTASSNWLLEGITGIINRFTAPSDRKLQKECVELGVVPLLVKLLYTGSITAKCRAATSLAHLSQNSLSLIKSKSSRWMCFPPSGEPFCEIHSYRCSVKSTFCLVKADSVSPLVAILKGEERGADEAVLNALATLLQDDIWESGSNAIDNAAGVEALIGILEVGSHKAKEGALWMMERIFRVENLRSKHGETAQALLIDLALSRDPTLMPMIVKLMAHVQTMRNSPT